MSDTQSTNAPVTDVNEIEIVITELQQYRQRIIDDSMAMAKQVKLSKKLVMKHLSEHDELAKIDAILEQLNAQKAALTESNS